MKTTHQRPKPSAGVLRRLKKQGGQAIVLLALTGTLLIGGVGIAVDLAVGYMYSIAAERAAAAAALSGVVFMPDGILGTLRKVPGWIQTLLWRPTPSVTVR